jgi:hypothetical protein
MNCENFENLINGYLDRELPDAQQKECGEHLLSCGKCAASIEEHTSIDKLLKESEAPLPDEAYWMGFDARLREKVDKAEEKKPWWNFFVVIKRPQVRWVAAAVTLLIIIAFGTPILREIAFNNQPGIRSAKESKHLPALNRSLDQPKMTTNPKMDESAKSEVKAGVGSASSRTNGKVEAGALRPDDKLLSEENTGVPDEFLFKKENIVPGNTPREESDELMLKDKESGAKDKQATSANAKNPPAVAEGSRVPSAPLISTPLPPVAKKCMPTGGEKAGVVSGDVKAEKFDNLYSIKNKVLSEPVSAKNYGRPAPGSGRYLASSEVVLLKIVNMNDDPKNLAMLKSNLKSSNYIKELNIEKESNQGNPAIEKHTEAMKEIAVALMSIEDRGVPDFKRKVLESGILEVTRELKK